MTGSADIVIIGGGLVGTVLAYNLSKLGHQTTLLDAGEPGEGTSGSSFAWLNSARKEPRVYHDLNVAGIAEHAALAAHFPSAPWYHPDGGLLWTTTEDGVTTTREEVARRNAWGYLIEEITTPEAMELEPGLLLDPEVVQAVWWTPGEGWCDVPLLIATLLHQAEEDGLTIRTGAEVVAIEQHGDRIDGVRLASGETIAAGAVVNCAGPHARAVAALCRVDLPVERVPGLLAVTAPVTPSGRRVCHADNVYFRPDPSGGLVIGHEEDFDRTITEITPTVPPPVACEEARERALSFRPAIGEVGIAAARIGIRPMPVDGVSIAGQLPGLRNGYVVVTHSGVTLGPLLGRLVAEEISTGRASDQLDPFRPDRFSPQ